MRTFEFIGNLSKADVDVLAEHAESAGNILEFGVGGSTQILAQAVAENVKILSLDTDKAWITTTRNNLRKLGVRRAVEFRLYDDWLTRKKKPVEYDLIFNDGLRDNRLPFAIEAWEQLKVGGKLLWHDTRRPQDVQDVIKLIETYNKEIESAFFNLRDSNITVLTKRAPLEYVNWNKIEGKADWQLGIAPIPEGAFPAK